MKQFTAADVREQFSLAEQGGVGDLGGVLHVTTGPAVGFRRGRVQYQIAAVVTRIHLGGDGELLELAEAGDGFSFGLGLVQSGHEQRHKNADDGDDDEQFDQAEAANRRAVHRPLRGRGLDFR